MDLNSFYFHSEPINQFLTDRDKTIFFKNALEKKYSRGIKIFEERTYPKGVFILKKGRVKIFQSSASGDEQIIAIHVAGEVFGYRPILSGERYPVSAQTLEPCSVMFIPKDDFVKVLETSTSFSNTLLKYLSCEFTVWVNTISIRSRTTVKERLLLNILLLSERYREHSKWPIKITLQKSDLACLIGTSNETLARMLKLLKQDGLILGRARSIEITGPLQLKRIENEVSLFI
jgi:CRP-like cAMP-binding protein